MPHLKLAWSPHAMRSWEFSAPTYFLPKRPEIRQRPHSESPRLFFLRSFQMLADQLTI